MLNQLLPFKTNKSNNPYDLAMYFIKIGLVDTVLYVINSYSKDRYLREISTSIEQIEEAIQLEQFKRAYQLIDWCCLLKEMYMVKIQQVEKERYMQYLHAIRRLLSEGHLHLAQQIIHHIQENFTICTPELNELCEVCQILQVISPQTLSKEIQQHIEQYEFVQAIKKYQTLCMYHDLLASVLGTEYTSKAFEVAQLSNLLHFYRDISRKYPSSEELIDVLLIDKLISEGQLTLCNKLASRFEALVNNIIDKKEFRLG